MKLSLGTMLLLPAGLWAAGCQATPDASDAVAKAPGNHKVILENDVVRVLEATVPLHTKEIPHTHFWPSVFFEQTSGVTEPWKTVNIRWSQGGPSKGFDSSDRDRHNLLIELKNAGCQPAPLADLPATDAVKSHDPNIAVVVENPYVRVLSVKIPPGGKEPWHTHTLPAVVVYFGLPPSVRSTQDGKKTPRAELKELQVTYDANSQPMHSIENLGKVTYQAYRIELKPTTAAKSLDPLAVDPKHYKLEVENEWVRAFRENMAPREQMAMHQHPSPGAAIVFLTDRHNRLTAPDGTSRELSNRAGEVLWSAPSTHRGENLTDAQFEAVQIEPRKPAGGFVVDKTDATVIDPKHYHVELENEYLRVIRVNVGPHEKLAQHTHPNTPAVLVHLTDQKMRLTLADGTSHESNFPAKEVRWVPPGIAHQDENLSNAPLQFVRIELK